MYALAAQNPWSMTSSVKSPPPLRKNWPIKHRSIFSERMVRQAEDQEWAIKTVEADSTKSELEKTFRVLANQWHQETWFISSIKKRISHPAHLKIIGLGLPAVPLIVREMKRDPDHWFWALEAITRDDPARNAKTIRELSDAWLAWARSHGY